MSAITFDDLNQKVDEKVTEVKDEFDNNLKTLHSQEKAALTITAGVNEGGTATADGVVTKNLPLSAYKGTFTMKSLPAGMEVALPADPSNVAIKFILSGSIHYGGYELTATDWIKVEPEQTLDFKVGEYGVTMLVSYSEVMPEEDPATDPA